MFFALNEENKKVPAKNLGETAICQFCKSPLITTKNSSAIFYWHHNSAFSKCDKWYSPISEWRFEWMSNFPYEWQEIIIKKEESNNTHIADIRLPDELILKFQDSKIISEEINEVENFFDKLLWIFDNSILGIFDFQIINKKILKESPYLQVNPYGKIKTNKCWELKKYLLSISKPLFIDLNHRILYIKKVISDNDGKLSPINDRFNLYKVYSEKDKYEHLILEIRILTKDEFFQKYHPSKIL